MIIEVMDGYELRCTDGMNWQVYQEKEVEKRGTGEKKKEWVGLPSYHTNPKLGVEWIANHAAKNLVKKNKVSLDGFIKEFNKILAQIKRNANVYKEAVKDGCEPEGTDDGDTA